MILFPCLCDIPSISGVIEEAVEKMETEDATVIPEKKYYIDTNSIRLPREGMAMSRFMKDCMGMYTVMCYCWL